MEHLDTLSIELDVGRAGAGRPSSREETSHGSRGSELAEKLGYQQAELAAVPAEVRSSFAGVGYHFDVASIDAGRRVLDVGCGSGTDTFVAAWHTGTDGRVVGVDERRNPVETAHGTATRDDRDTVSFHVSHLDALPFEAGTFDVAISNGAIHRHAVKDRVFREVHRVLKPDGRLVVTDVVSEERFPEWIESATNLQADCVGGAVEDTVYVDTVEAAGFDVVAPDEHTVRGHRRPALRRVGPIRREERLTARTPSSTRRSRTNGNSIMTPTIDHSNVSRRTVLQATGGSLAYVARPFSGGGGGDSDHEDGGDDTGSESDGSENGRDDTGAAVVSQTVDVTGQGPDGVVVAEAGATIHRTPGEILAAISMPRPEPCTYTYPSEPADREGQWWTDEAGDLEAFSLWAFVYDDPSGCETVCSGDDLDEPANGGAFYVDGHVFDGRGLALSGIVSTDAAPFEMGGDPLGVPLERPMDAEVHLAVAPHGAFDPAMLPDQLRTPTSPGPDIWWLATFEPP